MVRIIAGEFRSRNLLTVKDDEVTRPFLSRVKESVFSMLHEWFEEARVLAELPAQGGDDGVDNVRAPLVAQPPDIVQQRGA